MQPQYSPYSSQPKKNIFTRYPWVTIGVAVFIIAVVAVIITQHVSDNQAGHDTRTYDKYSHQTVSNIKGKTPETYGTTSNEPLYLGFTKLLEHGLTQAQVNTIQFALSTYGKQAEKSLTAVSVDIDSYKNLGAVDNNPAYGHSSFNVAYNYKDVYPVKLQYNGLDAVTIQIFDKSGAQVYNYSYDPATATDPDNLD